MNNFISKYIKKSGLRFMLLALPLGIAGAGSVASCSDWDDHYDGADSESSNISLWQQISSNPELSDFAEVLTQTKVFRQQNTSACSNARKQAVSTHFSRSPDLRIHSRRTAFSRSLPMADFRHVRGLHAYSGGTVPDFHRIHYSPRNPVGIPAALKRF